MKSLTELYGPVISSYTRAQAIEDGALVDVSHATDAHGKTLSPFKWPVAMTRAAYAATIETGGEYRPAENLTPTEEATGAIETLHLPGGQDVPGRLHDVFWMLLCAIRAGRSTNVVRFTVLVNATGKGPAKPVQLKSICGPGDDAEPVLTILLPDED